MCTHFHHDCHQILGIDQIYSTQCLWFFKTSLLVKTFSQGLHLDHADRWHNMHAVHWYPVVVSHDFHNNHHQNATLEKYTCSVCSSSKHLYSFSHNMHAVHWYPVVVSHDWEIVIFGALLLNVVLNGLQCRVLVKIISTKFIIIIIIVIIIMVIIAIALPSRWWWLWWWL